MKGNFHVRFGSGENPEMISKDYLSTYMVSIRPLFTKESNADAERQINSPGYFLNIQGGGLREDSKDFNVTAYNLTHMKDPGQFVLKDINKTKMEYKV